MIPAITDKQKLQLREEGWCVVPSLLTSKEIERVQLAIERIVTEMRTQGISTHTAMIDPNESNIRLYNLPDWDPVFVDLLRHPMALLMAEEVLGPDFIVSNFSGNIALPGSLPMNIHSDQALSVPPPWIEPWALNLIWCLDDVSELNGATRFVPGSHKYRTFEEVPKDIAGQAIAFEAPLGSMIVMDGRVWHTSGANNSVDRRRAMLFGYYIRDFVRQQVSWDVCLSPQTQAGLDEDARALLGMGPVQNSRIGISMTKLAN